MACESNATPVFADVDIKTFQICPKSIKKNITPKTKAFILNSPSNPTGAVYDLATLEAIAEFSIRHNLVVISDEIYEHFVYGTQKHHSIASLNPEIKARTIVINGVSKTFSMTGWRIGYAAGPKHLISAMGIIQSQSTSNPSSIAQRAAIGALREGKNFYSPMIKEFTERRQIIYTQLNSIPGITCLNPEGAFYGFANMAELIGKNFDNETIKTSSDLATYLIREARVAVVPGNPFGAPSHFRISYATTIEKIKDGILRINNAVQKI